MIVTDEKQYAKELVAKITDTKIDYIYNDSQDGACIGTGSMTVSSAKKIAVMMVDMALQEAYKQGTEISLLRQEYLSKVKTEIEKIGEACPVNVRSNNELLAELLDGLNELASFIHKNNIEKGFYEKEKNIGEMLCLIHSEVSEALEADRKDKYALRQIDFAEQCYYEDEFVSAYKDWVKGSFEEEMADIIIRVLDLCAWKGIDIAGHISAKIRYNAQREKYHGKKY